MRRKKKKERGERGRQRIGGGVSEKREQCLRGDGDGGGDSIIIS